MADRDVIVLFEREADEAGPIALARYLPMVSHALAIEGATKALGLHRVLAYYAFQYPPRCGGVGAIPWLDLRATVLHVAAFVEAEQPLWNEAAIRFAIPPYFTVPTRLRELLLAATDHRRSLADTVSLVSHSLTNIPNASPKIVLVQ